MAEILYCKNKCLYLQYDKNNKNYDYEKVYDYLQEFEKRLNIRFII